MNSLWSKCELATASLSCDLVRIRLADCRYSIATFSRGVGVATKGSTVPKLLMSSVRDTLDPRLHWRRMLLGLDTRHCMNYLKYISLFFCIYTQFRENYYTNKDQMSSFFLSF